MTLKVTIMLLSSIMLFVLLAAMFVPLPHGQALILTTNSVSFVQSADTYTDIMQPTANYGGSNYLYISYNGNSMQAVWLQFNLANRGIPDNAVIDNATLEVFPTIVTQTFQVSCYYCPNNSWNEYTINYENQPADYITSPPTAALDTTSVYSADQWFNWNVTSAVKDTWANASSSNLLTLVLCQSQFQTGYSILQIGSKELGPGYIVLYIHWVSTATQTPQPTISPSTPEFSSTILSITFLITATLLGTVVIKRKQSRRRI